MLKKNLIANFLGQGWTVLMNLAFVPLYIKYLGIEAYGLIGIFAVMQSLLTLLDIGLTPIITREMARYCGGGYENKKILDVYRTAELIAGIIAFFIAINLQFGSNWIATTWIKSNTLPIDLVKQSLEIMGFIAALRFMEAIYRSTVLGLQQQVKFNIFNGAIATLRALGAVAVLSMVSPTIYAFFVWQGIISLLSMLSLRYMSNISIASNNSKGQFSISILKEMWRFAAGVSGITALGLLLTQVDKILLSKLLTLEEFGYYTLASLVSGGLYMLVGPITQAYYPKFCEIHSRSDISNLTYAYHEAAKLVTVIVGSVAMVLIFFSETILQLWTQDSALAKKISELVSILAFGNLINCLMYMPYQIQLTYGWTKLAFKFNVISVLILVPAIILVVPRYGSIGAAWIWLFLNMGYATIGILLMHRRIFIDEKWNWFKNDVIIPMFCAASTAFIVKIIQPSNENSLVQAVTIIIALILTLFISSLSIRRVRQK